MKRLPFESEIDSLMFSFNNKTKIEKRETLLEIIIKYQESDYPWRARDYINPLLVLLDEVGDDKDFSCFDAIIRFYYNVHDFMNLYHLYLKKAKFQKEKGSGFAYISIGKAMEIRNAMPENIKPEFDLNKILEEYLDKAEYFKKQENKTPYLKIDPIEYSEEFLSNYDEVMEEVREEIDKVGDLHIPQQLWGIMSEKFSKRGIYWKSPDLMNPGVMFD